MTVQKCFDHWRYKAITSNQPQSRPVPSVLQTQPPPPTALILGGRKAISPLKRSPMKQRTPPRFLTDTVRAPALPIAMGEATKK